MGVIKCRTIAPAHSAFIHLTPDIPDLVISRTVLTSSSAIGTAVIGDVEVAAVDDDDDRFDDDEAEVGTNSSRRRAKRAAKMDELAAVKDAKDGIFLPGVSSGIMYWSKTPTLSPSIGPHPLLEAC